MGGLRTSYDVTVEVSPGRQSTFDLQFEFNVSSANDSYAEAFRAYLMSKASFTDALQARLNLSALIDQRNDRTSRDIFDPLVGWEIPTAWAELYLEQFPPVPPRGEAGYTFYVMNLSVLDDPVAGIDHWFVEPTRDPDTGAIQDWWRLEWDNDLNTPIGYPLNAWGGPDHQVFIDPTAYQWYQDWFHVWFGGGNERAPFGLQYEEVPAASRAGYLAGVVNNLVEGLAASLPFVPPPQEPSILLRNYVLSGSLNHSLDDLRWVSSDLALRSYLEWFLPFKAWEITTTFAHIDDFPELMEVVDRNTSFDGDRGFIDGSAVFDYLEENKGQFVLDQSDVFEILSVNFLYDNRSMVFAGFEFTGLGGSGMTAIFLKTDRLFYADGTRQKGLTGVNAHETGHNLGYFHQFGPNLRADFIDGGMGYFRGDLEYGTFWEDALYRVILRAKLLDVFDLLDVREPLDLAPEFQTFYRHYRELNFLTAYDDLVGLEGMLTDAVPPTAEAGSDLTVDEDAVTVLDGRGSSDNFRIFNYTWDLGDGTLVITSEPTVEKVWTDPGTFTVTLTVYDAAGNTATDTLVATVLDITPPTVSILSPSSGALLTTNEVEVTWTASDEGGGVDRIEVRLDDGTPIVPTPGVSSHTFAGVVDGRHIVALMAIDEAGNLASISLSFRVETAPAFVTPFIVGSSIAAAVAGGLIAGYMISRLFLRRRTSEETRPPPPE